MTLYLTEEEALKAVLRIRDSSYKFAYDPKKHKIMVLDNEGEEAIHFRLPITIPSIDDLDNLDDATVNYVILLIQSGSSALSYCEGDDMIDHKVFKSYMVRKKQGRSQVKYLKTKGKSRAGSRVRLASTLHFFEEINERLQQYFEENTIDRIALSCSKILIPYLFNAKVPCPFDKKDERILKIPKHIHPPGYDILLQTHEFLLKGEICYADSHESLARQFIESGEDDDYE